MRKILSLLLIFTVIFTAGACSDEETDYDEIKPEYKISAAEFSYQLIATYSNLCSLVENYMSSYGTNPLGFDPKISPEKQKYVAENESQETNNNYNTWMDYIIDTAYCAIQERKVLCDEARAEGLNLDEKDTKKIDTLIDDMINRYNLDKSGINAEALLNQWYGNEMTVEIFRKIQEEAILSEKYEKFKTDEFFDSYSYQDLKAIYEKNKSKYGTVGIAVYPLSYTYDKKADAKKKAEAILSQMTDFSSVERIVNKNSDAKNYAAALGSDLDYYDAVGNLKKWAFDSQRKTGDKKVFDGSGTYYVVYITKPVYDAFTYDSRHILLMADDTENVTDSTWQSLSSEADKILKEWEVGERTEASFAELAEIYSEDTGSRDNGGLYKNTRPDLFVEEYENWCLQPDRKYGDVDVVKTANSRYKGLHIIYFISQNGMPVWESELRSEKSSEDYQRFSNRLFSSECSKYTIDNNMINTSVNSSLEKISNLIKQTKDK